MKKIIRFAGGAIATALATYIALFLFWVLLTVACVQEGHTDAECKDNTLARIMLPTAQYLASFAK